MLFEMLSSVRGTRASSKVMLTHVCFYEYAHPLHPLHSENPKPYLRICDGLLGFVNYNCVRIMFQQ